MDKRTFIRELEKSLSVLQEKELNDIIGEYEQHIDMKVQSGLTEEEAIADFGSLSELSAEILEAYHVRADYAAGSGIKKEKKFAFSEGEKAGKEILQQTGEACVKTGKSTMRGLKRVGAWLWGVVLFWKVQLARPFAWAGRKWTAYKSEREENVFMQQADDATDMQDTGVGNSDMQNSVRPKSIRQNSIAQNLAGQTFDRRSSTRRNYTRRSRSLGTGIGHAFSVFMQMIAGLLRFGWKAFCWCVRVAWNLCWAGFVLFCGIMGVGCLFVLGMMLVLSTQGYPLAGLVIGCLGLNLCLFAAAGLGITFMRKSKHRLAAEETGEKNHMENGKTAKRLLTETDTFEQTKADSECQENQEFQEFQENEEAQNYQEQEVQEHA